MTDSAAAERSLSQLFDIYPEQQLRRIVAYAVAPTHDARFSALEKIIDQCYLNLVDGRADNNGESEDQLSLRIVDMLKSASVSAEHDTKVGGHCDVIVRGPDGFLWIGEAKVHSSYQWLIDGFLQLSTRYATAAQGRDRGEITIYHRKGNSLGVLRKWRAMLEEEFKAVAVTHEIREGELCFRTQHDCPNSGLPFYVRHCIIPLMHEPLK